MKKLFLIALVALISISAKCQKGQWAIGLNLGYTPSLESGGSVNNFGLSGKLQYGFTNALRGEIIGGYDFKDNEVSFIHAAVNLHYLFNVAKGVKVYPIVGVGYTHVDFGEWENFFDIDFSDCYWDYDDDVDSPSKDKLLINAGIGAEFSITPKLAISTEVKYQYIKDMNRLPINLGVIYKF